jgi:NAD(P)-dependent dehydrogenase (short-subunit alcohol dehydrogenase family)
MELVIQEGVSMSQEFTDKVVLVTGGSTGIGAAAALHFANAGARVLVTGRSEATLKDSAARHPDIKYVVADVGQPAQAAHSIDEVRSRYGRLDVLVNNAGIAEIAPLSDATVEHARRTFEVNVVGLLETTRLALPLLRQSKGAIVNVASTVADAPFASMSVYCASKAAVLAFTRSWAQELAAEGVRVNAVSPGPIDTPIFTPGKLRITEQQLRDMGASVLALVPSGRFGKPDEVAQVIAFLASSAASYVTGAQYTVGGGIEA